MCAAHDACRDRRFEQSADYTSIVRSNHDDVHVVSVRGITNAARRVTQVGDDLCVREPDLVGQGRGVEFCLIAEVRGIVWHRCDRAEVGGV